MKLDNNKYFYRRELCSTCLGHHLVPTEDPKRFKGCETCGMEGFVLARMQEEEVGDNALRG